MQVPVQQHPASLGRGELAVEPLGPVDQRRLHAPVHGGRAHPFEAETPAFHGAQAGGRRRRHSVQLGHDLGRGQGRLVVAAFEHQPHQRRAGPGALQHQGGPVPVDQPDRASPTEMHQRRALAGFVGVGDQLQHQRFVAAADELDHRGLSLHRRPVGGQPPVRQMRLEDGRIDHGRAFLKSAAGRVILARLS